jgi:leucyl aminopeptidase
MKIQFVKTLPTEQKRKQKQTLVFPLFEEQEFKAATAILDKAAASRITTILKSTKPFKGKIGEASIFYIDDKITITLLGLGAKDKWNAGNAETAGGKLCVALNAEGIEQATLIADKLKHAEHITAGVKLRAYNFDKYKKPKKDDKLKLETLAVFAADSSAIKKAYTPLDQTIDGVYLTRNLVNEAPNVLYPDMYAKLIKDELKPLGIQVEILDDKKMEKLGMGAIMAVGQGSSRKPRMVVMVWNGTGKKLTQKDQPVALVGKGVTFDTGGISLKPGAGMDEMKMDMGGSAAVVGAMKALATQKSKSYVIGIVGLAENMPSGDAYRPGDIITSYAGKTIEVLNTDAEGRLVLADTLTYVQKTYNPHTIVDLATLTGAMMVALGHEYCGTYVNDDTLWKQMETAAADAQEKIWRMPLDEAWSEEVVSTVADLRNMGKGRFAGAGTAAAFLEHFIDKDRKWAHMDIAGTAWITSDKPTTPKYGTGFGVRTLTKLVQTCYETKN